MFWNVASSRDEISLHKWSGCTAQWHTLDFRAESQTLGPRGRFWACDAFWNFQTANV